MQPGHLPANTDRMLQIHILRFNPQDSDSKPRLDSFHIKEAFGMTLFIALREIQEKYDPSLQVDFFCSHGYCGSCSMVINGRPGLACKTLTKNLSAEITLAPLPGFAIIGDLAVDMSHYASGILAQLERWIEDHSEAHDTQAIMAKIKPRKIPSPYASDRDRVDVRRLEGRLDPALAEQRYQRHSCIECGCCIATHGTRTTRQQAPAASQLQTIATLDFMRGTLHYELVRNAHHVFGFISALDGENTCPKQLPEDARMVFFLRKIAELKLLRLTGKTLPYTELLQHDTRDD
jgi:fumarate reductase iron-sulfur subunit